MARVKGDATKQCCSGHWVSDSLCEGRVWNCQTLSSESKGKGSSFSGYNYLSADETGIKPVDDVITKTLAFEQSYLGKPLVQFAVLALAAFGTYTLVKKYL